MPPIVCAVTAGFIGVYYRLAYYGATQYPIVGVPGPAMTVPPRHAQLVPNLIIASGRDSRRR